MAPPIKVGNELKRDSPEVPETAPTRLTSNYPFPASPAMAATPAQLAFANPPAASLLPSLTRRSRQRPRVRCVTTAGTTRPYWATAEAEIEAHLAASIPAAYPPSVRDPIFRLLSSAPRTMAPVLCVAACELVGGRMESALGAACALRLVHSAFCAHGSLLGLPNTGPADAAMRDGVKLLTADGLVPMGYQLVAESDGGGDLGRVLKVLLEITDATGPQGILEGQYEEALLREGGGTGGQPDVEWVERVCRKEEGRLYGCAAACGAILGRAGEEETERLRRCGTYMGMLHGYLCGVGGGGGFSRVGTEERDAVAGKLRSMALSELEGFEREKKETIVGIADVRLR